MGSDEVHYNAPYHSAMTQCIAGTAAQRAKWCTRSPIPWDPMDPPEVGPRGSPGLWGPEEVWRRPVRYTTMRHNTGPCRSVLRVLLRRGRSGVPGLPYPEILWTLLK